MKPFSKSVWITAAACGAVIVVPLSEGDAQYYVGHDYPFALKDDSLPAVREMLERAEAAFGGTEWRFAQSIMDSVRDRCSPRHVAGDFAHFLATARA